jgi:hypothetical protein
MPTTPTQEPHHDAETEHVMATVRRLKAALAPSAQPASVPDELVVAEIERILDSEGLQNLLAHSGRGYFCSIIQRAEDAVAKGGPPRNIIDRLWTLMDSRELNAALASDDPDEQPARLVQLMLDGPYKDAQRGGN